MGLRPREAMISNRGAVLESVQARRGSPGPQASAANFHSPRRFGVRFAGPVQDLFRGLPGRMAAFRVAVLH